MPSLIDHTIKNEYQNVLNDLHLTFARSLTGYKPVNITSFTESNNLNYIYGDKQPDVTITSTTVSGVFDARVKYQDVTKTSDYIKSVIDGDINIKKGGALIQIKLTLSDFTTYLEGAKYIKFDDITCTILTEPRNHGLFNPIYKTVLLAEVK
ncbi:MAG: hypothetical protein AABY22_12315 [Nanoarchaeota archaeon]